MKKIFTLLFVLVCFFSIVGFTNAKSATCTYGNEGGISIIKEIYLDNTNFLIEKLFSENIDDNADKIETDCDSYLGSPVYDETKTTQSPAYYLQFAFKIMKYAAIILLLVLTIVEFVKASTSNDQNAIKKAFQNTIKRVIVAVIIFILPELIKFLLTVLGVYSPSTCGIK